VGYERTADWQVYSTDGRRKYLDANERRRFLDAADKEAPAARSLCRFLLLCGCRISEALALRTDQIDRSANTVILRTLKRRRTVFRRVPLPPELIAMLIEIAPSDGLVWPIHRVTAWRWVIRVMEQAAIDGPMACCRGARHTFAIHAAGRHVPPNLLQKWMGHASLATTAIYLDAVGADEQDFARRMW
jgi:integrase/recombinase XerD